MASLAETAHKIANIYTDNEVRYVYGIYHQIDDYMEMEFHGTVYHSADLVLTAFQDKLEHLRIQIDGIPFICPELEMMAEDMKIETREGISKITVTVSFKLKSR